MLQSLVYAPHFWHGSREADILPGIVQQGIEPQVLADDLGGGWERSSGQPRGAKLT